MADTTTSISRKKLSFPDIGYSGGTPLEDLVKAMFQTLGDNLGTRYEEYTSIGDSTTVELDHNFGAAFAEYKILLYTGTGTNLTRVEDPSGSGWTIAAKTGSEKLIIEITTPSSGGPHDFTVIMAHGTFIESLDDLDDFDNTGVANGYIPIWSTANGRYEPGVNTVSPWTTSVQTSGPYASSNREEIFCNTSGGPFTVNLPGSPSLGWRVRIIDFGRNFGTNTLTVGRNGNNILGSASDFTLSTDGQSVELVFDGTDSWEIV